jgi:gluconate 2-dehydrogenase gamma chain
MEPSPVSRRDFVAAAGALGALWLLADPRDRRAAADHAHRQAGAPQPALQFFASEQAAEIEAAIERIMPADDTPGARELGVLWFIDRALATWAKPQQPVFTEGLRQLATAVSKRHPGQARFSALMPAQQDDVLRSIQETPFFGALRFATLAGMFSLPSHGGNRDFAGWAMLGQDRVMDFRPPFGWYDQPENRRALLRPGGR